MEKQQLKCTYFVSWENQAVAQTKRTWINTQSEKKLC